MFQAWVEAVSEVVLDEGLREAGLPPVAEAYQQLVEFLKNDISVSKDTLAELGLHATDQRRSHGPVVDPSDMNEIVRRQLLAAEEEHKPRGWQFNQPQPTDEEYEVPALSEAAQSAKDGPFFASSSPEHQQAYPVYQDTPTPREPPSAQILPEELAGRQVDGDGRQVTITFSEQGQIGIQYMRAVGAWSKGVNAPDRAAALVVQEVLPGSLASQHASLRPGLILTKIDGVSVKGAHFEHSMRRMKGARPLKLTFEGIEGLRCASSVATPRANLNLETPLSTGQTPRLEPDEESDETVWESTDDEIELVVEPHLFAAELAWHVIDAVERSRLRGFFSCPVDGCGDPRRFEIRALEAAEAAEGPTSAVCYYATPGSPKPEWGFNPDGEYVMVMGEIPARVEPDFVQEWYTQRDSDDLRFVVRAGTMADVQTLLAASASTDPEAQEARRELEGRADSGLGRVAALAAKTLSSDQAEDLVVVVEIRGELVAQEAGGIVAVMILCNAAGSVAAVGGNDNDASSSVQASGDEAGATAQVQVATAVAYQRRGLGELLLKIATGIHTLDSFHVKSVADSIVPFVDAWCDSAGRCSPSLLALTCTGVITAIGKAPAIEALVPRELFSATDRSDNMPATDGAEPSIVKLLRQEGYSEDLNLGEGEHARLLLVLHATMRDAEIAPLEDEEGDVNCHEVEELGQTELDKDLEEVEGA